MKPTTRAIRDLLTAARGEWVNHATFAAVGGHRYGARIMELRPLGYVIEQQGNGERSRYRLTSGPPSPYTSFSCPSCGWKGEEPAAIRGQDGATMLCPNPVDGRVCSTATQTVLLWQELLR